MVTPWPARDFLLSVASSEGPEALKTKLTNSRRLSFNKIREPLEVPNLLDLQIESFDWLMGNEKWQARVKTALDAGRTDVPTTSGLTEIL